MDTALHRHRRLRSSPTRPRHGRTHSPQPDSATPPLKRMRVDPYSSHPPSPDHARNHGGHGLRRTVHLPQHGGSTVNLITKRVDAPPTTIDASDLFKNPQRASRPDRFVVILRGLPGSGKSYLAKALRDVEVMNGGSAPRIHSLDDYFMIEVEKDVGEGKDSKSGSKRSTKKVIEYCYEAEMEETYRSYMLKAFRKTLDERKFTFVIVDDRNLREADFSQFWAVAKRSGYEVYLLEAPYKDPMGCAARNLHGFTLDEIQKMAAKWEQAPQWLYCRLDIQSLFHGDDLKEKAIRKVNINMKNDTVLPTQDVADNNDNCNNDRAVDEKPESPRNGYDTGPLTSGEMWYTDTEEEQVCVRDLSQSKWWRNIEEETENPEFSEGKEELVFVRDPSQIKWLRNIEEETDKPEESVFVRDLSQSKWSKDIEAEMEKPEALEGKEEQIAVKDLGQSKLSRNVEENIENPEASKGNGHAPSGLVHAYGNSRKSVRWGDQADLFGFFIGSASSKLTGLSLVIGPGSGYNLKSNPLNKWSRNIEEETKNPESSKGFVRDPSQSKWSRNIEEETENPEDSVFVRDLSQSKWSKDIEAEMEKPEAFKSKEEQIAVEGVDQSKWSRNVEENIENPEASKGNGHAPSSLVHAYGKSRKSVRWGDQAGLVGFSIGSVSSKPTNLSLVIGPGSGYNLKSNPLSKEEKESWNRRGNINLEKKKKSREQLRAEWRSVKAIFDQRRVT